MRGALLLAFCLLCGSAFAEEGVRWRYVAPPECPSEQEFRAQVRARLLRNSRVSESAQNESYGAGVTVEVRLEPSERRAVLRLEEPGAPVVERTVEGDSCAELASGLALITALAFGAEPEPTNATTPDAPRASEPEAATPTNTPTRPRNEAPFTKTVRTEHGKQDRGSARSLRSSSRPLGMEGGAGGWLNTWSAPAGALGADAFLRLAPRAHGGWSLRVAGLYGFGSSSVEDRRAAFTFLGGRAEGCPISEIVPLELLGEACLALDLGALRGQGEEGSALLEGASRTVFWAAAAIVGRVRGRLGERIFLEGQAELGLPLVRHEFVFEEPRDRIFRTPAAGFGARVGLGVQFL
jgi:hypothetical protein